MALRRLTIEFDDTDDPKLKKELDKIESPSNHDRYRRVRAAVATFNSTSDDRVKDVTIETIST